MEKTIDTILKFSKKNQRLNLLQMIVFASIFIVFPVSITLFSIEGEEPNFLKMLIVMGIDSLIYFGIIYKYLFYKEEKNLKEMLESEKASGQVVMYNPYMRIRKRDRLVNIIENNCDKVVDKKYFLFFYPYKGDHTTKVKYPISEELYNKYKNEVENYTYRTDNVVPVIINSSTGLFDGEVCYTTKSLDIPFEEY